MSRILSEEREEFEVIVATPPKPRVGLPEDRLRDLVSLLDRLGWDKSKLKRYVNAALRLRKLEREGGRSYLSLLRSYRKLSSEEVKLRYSIDQLKEKRRRLEEDLNLYMEQHKLTLDLLRKTSSILSALRERGLGLEDLESGVSLLESLKKLGYDPARVIDSLKMHGDLVREIDGLERLRDELKSEIDELKVQRDSLLREISEIHHLGGELEELNTHLQRLRQEEERLGREVEEKRKELNSIKDELREMTGFKGSIQELQETVAALREKVEELRREEATLRMEIENLLGVRAEAEEINARLEKAREELRKLEKAVEDRRSYVEIVEGETAAAYAILRLFTDPDGVEAEDLETLAQQMENLARVKRGEISALKPLEPHLLERVRQSIITLIMPYIRKEFVPRKAFERIESELRRLSERRTALEAEVESLRRALESKSKERVEIVPTMEVEAVSSTGEVLEPKSLMEGRRVRVVCPNCGKTVLTRIPTAEELEALDSKGYKLRFTCGICGRSFDVEAGSVLKRIRR